jgi:hypothetical protein
LFEIARRDLVFRYWSKEVARRDLIFLLNKRNCQMGFQVDWLKEIARRDLGWKSMFIIPKLELR